MRILLQDYEEELEVEEKQKQENCGPLAGSPPKRGAICKVEKEDLFKVKTDALYFKL